MAAHRFHDAVAVYACGEARAEGDDERRVRDVRAEVALCNRSIHKHVRPVNRAAFRGRVNDDGRFTAPECRADFRLVPAQARGDVFDRSFAAIYRIRECDRAAHGRRLGQFGQNQGKTRMVQAQGCARREIARSAHQDQHPITSFRNAPTAQG